MWGEVGKGAAGRGPGRGGGFDMVFPKGGFSMP